MAVKEAECRIEDAAEMTARGGRRIVGEVKLNMTTSLTPAQLGGNGITLKLTGLSSEQMKYVMQLVIALKKADTETAKAIISELRALTGDQDDISST